MARLAKTGLAVNPEVRLEPLRTESPTPRPWSSLTIRLLDTARERPHKRNSASKTVIRVRSFGSEDVIAKPALPREELEVVNHSEPSKRTVGGKPDCVGADVQQAVGY